jgi:glycosyltransferase involved in cell wall biosynthesis
MYSLAVGAIFKNESHCLKEWLEHYILHGAEHFFLVDDGSTDQSCDILQEYVDRGIVTLYKADWSRYLGRQMGMYNTFILPCCST